MVYDEHNFENRVRRLVRKHHAMSRGYVTRVRSDGLIVAKPRRSQSRISGRSLLVFTMAFFLFKGFLFANLGPEAYDDRVSKLQNGTAVEQVGGWVMQSEMLTEWIGAQIGPILR